MIRDFQNEAYSRMLEASKKSKSADIDGVFWDAAGLIGKDLKAMHTRSGNFEMMLMKLIRGIRRKDDGHLPPITQEQWEAKLKELADKAADLYTRLVGAEGILR